MSFYNYMKSKEILINNPTFASLIMAAAEKARTISFNKLQTAFPRIVGEFQKRNKEHAYGLLDGDEVVIEIGGEKFKKIYRINKEV